MREEPKYRKYTDVLIIVLGVLSLLIVPILIQIKCSGG